MNQKFLEKKKESVLELSKKFKEAKTIVIFEYPGLTVGEISEVRRTLRKNNVEIKVYKNNIARRAAIEAGLEGFDKLLVGPKAVALSYTDVVAPAKVLFDSSKTYKKLVLGGGVIEGKLASEADILDLASIPSREVLLTQLAVGLLSPLQQLAIGLDMIANK